MHLSKSMHNFADNSAGTMRRNEAEKSLMDPVPFNSRQRKTFANSDQQITTSMKTLRNSGSWVAKQPLGSYHDSLRRSKAPLFIGSGPQSHINLEGTDVLDPHSGIWSKPCSTVPWQMTRSSSTGHVGSR